MRRHTFQAALRAFIAAGLSDRDIELRVQSMMTSIRSRKVKDKNLQPPRNYTPRPSKYMPHQGARECERRRVGGFAWMRSTPADLPLASFPLMQRSSLAPLI